MSQHIMFKCGFVSLLIIHLAGSIICAAESPVVPVVSACCSSIDVPLHCFSAIGFGIHSNFISQYLSCIFSDNEICLLFIMRRRGIHGGVVTHSHSHNK